MMTTTTIIDSTTKAAPARRLTLWDTTSIIVGIIIGSAIFKSSPLISSAAAGWVVQVLQYWTGWPGPEDISGLYWAQVIGIVGIWLLGGGIALLGALCYAELSTALPHEGGNYVFLTTAFGRSTGLAFAWIEFWIVRPGNVGAISFVAATFAMSLCPASLKAWLGPRPEAVLAVLFIAALTVVNLLGIQMERWTQNLLTAAKLLGLVIVALTALLWLGPANAPSASATTTQLPSGGMLPLAFVLMMFAYGGWSDMPYVAAEVAEPRRNLMWSLLLGTASVMAIYLFLILCCVRGLGLPGLYGSQNIASDVMTKGWGARGEQFVSLLVVTSCLGAIHGMLFTGARVFYKLGSEHTMFSWLGKWNEQGGVPARALVVQSAVTIALVGLFGASSEAFERLVIFTGPFYWGFIFLVAFALIVLRDRGSLQADRYRVPLFPIPPLLFGACCLWMAYSGFAWAMTNRPWEGLWAAGVVVTGAIVLVWEQKFGRENRRELEKH
jgi:APA family basic amino acid/polyamine antiporter